MSKKDMLGPTVRALVGVDVEDHGLVLEVINRLGSKDRAAWRKIYTGAHRTGLSQPKCEADCERVRIIDANTIEVNLDAPPKSPFGGAAIEANAGGGWVKVEKRADGLYQDGRKLELHLEPEQEKEQYVRGHELRKRLASKPNIHPNVLDAAVEHGLMPKDWQTDEKGRMRYIFSFAVVYRNSDGDLYVRYWYFSGGRWRSDCSWLDYDWRVHSPSALAASTEA